MKRRLNIPLLLSLLLLTALAAVLVLPAFVELKHPQVAQLTAWVAENRLKAPPFAPGEYHFVLGSDNIGRDLLSRLVYGARYTLALVAVIAIARTLLAVPLGMLAGHYGGRLFRVVTLLSTGFSSLPLLVMVGLLLLRLKNVMATPTQWLVTYCLVMILAGFPRMADHVARRSQEVSLMNHVEGAVALGATNSRIIWRHLFPVMRPDLLVLLAAEAAWVLLLLGQLAIFQIYPGGDAVIFGEGGRIAAMAEFLPEWGAMMGVNRGLVLSGSLVPVYPALALGLTAVAFHLLAEGLRLRSLKR